MFEELLCRAADALNAAGIPYMIIGGQAVLIHGVARMTQDIDITLGIAPDQVGALLVISKKAGWEVLPPDPEQFAAATFVLPVLDTVSAIRIDFIFSYTPFETEAIAHAVTRRINGVDIAYVSVEDLVIHKVFAGRPRDLDDARGILLKKTDINRPYIREWLATMSEGSEVDLLARFEGLHTP